MLLKTWPVLFAFLIVLPAVTLAQSVPHDPQILIDTGGDPMNISTSINQVQPSTDCPIVGDQIQCAYDFINDTSLLTSFTFETIINKGLSAETVSSSFSCLEPSGYFLNCSVTYNSDTGDLKYFFSGVLPADGDETPGTGFDPEIGEHEGIPTGGVFHITLIGWTTNAGDGTLYSGLPTLSNSFTTVPEPSSVLSILTELGLLAGVVIFSRNRWNLKRRFNR